MRDKREQNSTPRVYHGAHNNNDILTARARMGKYITGVFFVFLPLLAAFTAVMA